MNWKKQPMRIGLVIGLASSLISPAPLFAQNSGGAAGVPGSKNIRSLKEIRGEAVTRQRWDISCGAAALSTVLTYDYNDPTPESAIVVWILHRVDAARVRERGGFSLLDLKHFATARGYHAEGYSGMTMEDLLHEKGSKIVPLHFKTVDHFVVVKEIVDGHVLMADPAFGNVTMRVDRFQELWKSGIAFVVHPPDERMAEQRTYSIASRLVPDETAITRRIGVTAPSNYLY